MCVYLYVCMFLNYLLLDSMVFINTKFTYDANGNLFCIICKSIIKSSSIWKVHVNSKLHKLNVEEAKKINKTTVEKYINNKVNNVDEAKSSSNLDKAKYKSESSEQSKPKATPNQDNEPTETLPETFFDNPTVDMKNRRLESRNHQNDEWEKFQLEIKEAELANELKISEPDNLELNKEITEISEQMHQWSKVIKLESKLLTIVKPQKFLDDTQNSEESTSDDEVDDHLDWRSKKIT